MARGTISRADRESIRTEAANGTDPKTLSKRYGRPIKTIEKVLADSVNGANGTQWEAPPAVITTPEPTVPRLNASDIAHAYADMRARGETTRTVDVVTTERLTLTIER